MTVSQLLRRARPFAIGLVLVPAATAQLAAQGHLEHVGTIEGPANLVKFDDGRAFVTHHRTFTVFDLSDPTAPQRRGSLELPEEIWKFSIRGDRAYVGANFHGLAILDISDPTAPHELGTFQSLGQTKIGAVFDTKLASIDHMEGLVLIDISDESDPQSIGSYFLDGYARDVVTSGSIAYATDSPTGLYVFDLARDGVPEPISILHAPAAPRSALQVTDLPNGSKLLAGIGAGGLQVYDVTDPMAPVKTATFDTPGQASGLALRGQLAYVADGESGLQVVDLSDPTAPRITASFPTDRPARDVAVSDSLVLVVAGQSEREGDDRDVLIMQITP